jgi:hypothetical protein
MTDTLAAVVRGEPSWDALPDGVSPTLRVFLRRCLHKDPGERVHDIGDVRLALQRAFDAPSKEFRVSLAAAHHGRVSPWPPLSTAARTWYLKTK